MRGRSTTLRPLGPELKRPLPVVFKQVHHKDCLMLSYQMIDRIEFMHSKGFLHCDLMPNNFLMGVSGQCSVVSLVDLGLAKK